VDGFVALNRSPSRLEFSKATTQNGTAKSLSIRNNCSRAAQAA
jgi:hypothetical protein